MEALSEPITSLRCPSCGALVPIFEKLDRLTCNACSAEFPVRYVEPAEVVRMAEDSWMPLVMTGFAMWLLSRFKK